MLGIVFPHILYVDIFNLDVWFFTKPRILALVYNTFNLRTKSG
jgi:hypothetical protein